MFRDAQRYDSSKYVGRRYFRRVEPHAQEKCPKCAKIAHKLKDTNHVGSILPSFKSLMFVPNFSSKVIDHKTHLFAFTNRVFDFHTKDFRDIVPTDYIMTTTDHKWL